MSMKKVLALMIAGVVLCAGITACGKGSESGNNVVTVEKESVPSAEGSNEPAADTGLSIPGLWQTASIGYDDGESMQPEYYVQFTDSEIQYGHMKDGEFSLDHADKISTIEKAASGGFRVQAENSNGFKYTYLTCETDSTILEYYGTWDENEFADTYSGSSSLSICVSDQAKEPTVSVDFLDDDIVFNTDENVEDFRVYSLELDIHDDGTVDYIPTEVYREAELTKDSPATVHLEFPGDMSLNGFSYKGSDGSVKTFTIGISGMDGSLVINAEDYELPD